MCEHHVHHSHHTHQSHCAPHHTGCCCGPTGSSRGTLPGRRRFPTREERIVQLEEYLQGLEAEAQAVKEHIAALETADQE